MEYSTYSLLLRLDDVCEVKFAACLCLLVPVWCRGDAVCWAAEQDRLSGLSGERSLEKRQHSASQRDSEPAVRVSDQVTWVGPYACMDVPGRMSRNRARPLHDLTECSSYDYLSWLRLAV